MKCVNDVIVNIIFLDIDGVFVTHRSFIGSKDKVSGMRSEFDPIAMEMVRKLCVNSPAKIVISSVWRKISILETGTGSKNMLFNQFVEAGLSEHIFMPAWRTVDLWSMMKIENIDPFGPVDPTHPTRGDEIDRWLKFNGENVKNYCIIDDDYDFSENQKKNHFVHTDMNEGFLYCHYLKAKEILEKP